MTKLKQLLLAATATAAVFTTTAAFADAPDEPRIIDLKALGKSAGKQGGSIDLLMAKTKDVRWMTVYSGARLVAYNNEFKLAPDILKSIENDSNKSFTLHLRKGHKWSDGTPFTTEDFRYWWEDVANNPKLFKGGPPRQLLVNGNPPKVEIIDSHTIKFSWETVNPLFLTALAGARPLYLYMPAHFAKQFHEKYADKDKLAAQIESEKVQNWASLHKRFTRQYRPEYPEMPTLQAWMNTTKLPSERIIFKRNPNYHRIDSNGIQLPYIDQVILNMASSSIIAAKTGTGESDLQARYIRFDDFTFLKHGAEKEGFNVYLWPSGRGSEMTLIPNLNAKDDVLRTAFQDVRVRRALSMGVDRSDINETLFFGLARESANSVLPASPLYDEKHATAYATRDVKAANQLLDEAGFDKRASDGTRLMSDGRKFEIIIETAGESSQETDILQMVTRHWKDLGIKLFIKPSQRDILRGRVSIGEAAMSTWQGLNRGLAAPNMNPEELAPVSPIQAQWPIWGNYYETKGAAGEAPTLPKVARLSELYTAWRIAPNEEEQAKIWTEMLGIFTDQVYTIGIVSGGLQPIVVNKKLQNVPEEGIWAFEPTLYFGQYLPDTFWIKE